MPPTKVTVSLDPVTHKLVANPDIASVEQGASIMWDKNTNEIKWIRIIPPRSLFNPPVPNGDWSGHPIEILRNIPADTFKYSIAYETIHWGYGTLDPKIAVKPSPTNPVIFIISFLLVISLFVMRSFRRLQKLNATGEK